MVFRSITYLEITKYYLKKILTISPVIEQFRFNKIALFSFSIDLGWSTCVEARIQNLPQSAFGKLPNFTKIQDGRHYSIQNH